MTYIIRTDGTTISARNTITMNDDYVGQDAADVINNVINSLPNGGNIFIKKGTYLLNNKGIIGGDNLKFCIRVKYSNILIEGEGWSTILKQADNQNSAVIVAEGYSRNAGSDIKEEGIRIKNIAIDVNKQNNTVISAGGQAIVIWNCNNHEVSNVKVTNPATNAMHIAYGNGRVRGNYLDASNSIAGDALIVTQSTGEDISGNVVLYNHDSGISSSGTGGTVYKANDFVHYNRVIYTKNDGSSGHGILWQSSVGAKIHYNFISKGSIYVDEFGVGQGFSYDIDIASNYIENGSIQTWSCKRVSIHDNIIINSDYAVIYNAYNRSSITSDFIADGAIYNNHIIDARYGAIAIGGAGGFAFKVKQIDIYDNKISASDTLYGIYFDPGMAADITVHDNKLRGNIGHKIFQDTAGGNYGIVKFDNLGIDF